MGQYPGIYVWWPWVALRGWEDDRAITPKVSAPDTAPPGPGLLSSLTKWGSMLSRRPAQPAKIHLACNTSGSATLWPLHGREGETGSVQMPGSSQHAVPRMWAPHSGGFSCDLKAPNNEFLFSKPWASQVHANDEFRFSKVNRAGKAPALGLLGNS